MKTYDRYKSSGIDWIGDIPEHWETKKLKFLAEIETGGTPPKADDENYSNKGVSWIKPDNLNGFNPIFESKEKISEKGMDRMRIIPKGSVLVCGIGTIGKFGVAGCELVTNQQINSVIFNERLNHSFGKYIIASSESELLSNSNKVVVAILNKTSQSQIFYPVPPLDEQTAIADYLDEKTTQIDSLINNKLRLIKLLKEERMAIINQAVTRGINARAKLKPSGIAWLGDIPEHWEVKKLKYWINSTLGGGTPSTSNTSFWNGNIPWVSPKDMKTDFITKTEDYITKLAVTESATNLIPPERILIVVRSGILKHTLPVAINKVEVSLNQDMKAFEPNSKLLPLFLFWKLKGQSKDIITTCNKIGATVDSIEMEDLFGFPFAVPPIEEQKQIVEYIETATSKIDATIAKIEKEIGFMGEYRTALISEVVTGKIKVI